MKLRKTGGVALAGDVTGCAFEAIYPDIQIMDLGEDSTLDITIHFDTNKASKHARYSTCAAVGMKHIQRDTYRITFELHDDKLIPRDVLLRAIDCLEKRVDRSLLQISNQPNPPPRSRCG